MQIAINLSERRIAMTRRKPLAAGNWKMFGSGSQVEAARELAGMLAGGRHNCDVAICPPATLLPVLAGLGVSVQFGLGGQDCHASAQGAHTGDISSEMLRDAGASYVILGHSERRTDHYETDAMVAGKTDAAWRAGLEPIVCIGETAAQNKAGQTAQILERQLSDSIPASASLSGERRLTIAYEPVWAIGTGKTPTTTDIERLHGMIHGRLKVRFGTMATQVRVLYGGSVKPDNASSILALPGVDGALVGGASLKAKDFYAIISSYS
jgi:triosephosphate isomerase